MYQAVCENVCLVSWNSHDDPAESGLPLQRFTGEDLGPEVKPLATSHRGSEWYRQDCSSGLSDQRHAPICSPTLPPAFLGMEPVAFETKDLAIWAGALRRMCA